MPFELDKVSAWFPNLVVELTGKASFCITGDIQVAATVGNFSIDEVFSIKIAAENFPENPPQCLETSGKVLDYHVNAGTEKALCLASRIATHKILHNDPSIITYINKLVIPFFVSFRYCEKYGVSPFGELDHGGRGLLSEYKTYLKVDDVTLCVFLTYGTKYLYRGHHICPCGSGFALRKCHGRHLRELFDGYNPKLLYADILDCIQSTNCNIVPEKKELLIRRAKRSLNALKCFIKGGDKE